MLCHQRHLPVDGGRGEGYIRRPARYAGAVATLIWLIVWLIQGTPDLEWFGTWNDWSVSLLCCLIFDVFSGREASRIR